MYAPRRNWNSPQPPPRRLVCPPPPVSGGRGTLAGEKGVGRVPIPTRGIHCGTLYMYVLCEGSQISIDTICLLVILSFGATCRKSKFDSVYIYYVAFSIVWCKVAFCRRQIQKKLSFEPAGRAPLPLPQFAMEFEPILCTGGTALTVSVQKKRDYWVRSLKTGALASTLWTRGSQRDVVYLGWPIAPSYMSPMRGGGELRGLSQWVQMYTWSPNKLWSSNSIFNLCFERKRESADTVWNYKVKCGKLVGRSSAPSQVPRFFCENPH